MWGWRGVTKLAICHILIIARLEEDNDESLHLTFTIKYNYGVVYCEYHSLINLAYGQESYSPTQFA